MGLMIGIECSQGQVALAATRRLLELGYVTLPSGEDGRVVSLTPPLSIGEAALEAACIAIADCLTSLDRLAGSQP
jgi:acetylornithine/succinyldiaminopimelate/putrescine aminotransferase